MRDEIANHETVWRMRHTHGNGANQEGLTFTEWRAAAQCWGARVSYVVALRAWAYGEDPTEYAGH